MTPWHMSETQSSWQHERHLQIGLGLSCNSALEPCNSMEHLYTPADLPNNDAYLKLIVKARLSGKTYSNTKPVPKTARIQSVGQHQNTILFYFIFMHPSVLLLFALLNHFKIFQFLFDFFALRVLPEYMHHKHVWRLWGTERVCISCNWLTNDCQPPFGCQKLNLGLLGRVISALKQLFLSHQPPWLFFFCSGSIQIKKRLVNLYFLVLLQSVLSCSVNWRGLIRYISKMFPSILLLSKQR